MTAQEVIKISEQIPIREFEQAEKIAEVFQEQHLVYIPGGSFFLGFWRMISAIWYGGYIAGVQAERRKRRRSLSFCDPRQSL